jgi:hypothetical protein
MVGCHWLSDGIVVDLPFGPGTKKTVCGSQRYAVDYWPVPIRNTGTAAGWLNFSRAAIHWLQGLGSPLPVG